MSSSQTDAEKFIKSMLNKNPKSILQTPMLGNEDENRSVSQPENGVEAQEDKAEIETKHKKEGEREEEQGIESKQKEEESEQEQEIESKQEAEIDFTGGLNVSEESDFIQACTRGDHEAVSLLLEGDASLANTAAKNGFYPLMLAALNGDVKLIELLLKYKAVIDAEVRHGHFKRATALWLVSARLSKEADDRWRMISSDRTLIEQGLHDSGKKLIEEGASDCGPSTKHPNRHCRGTSALWYIINAKEHKLANKLIKNTGSWINDPNIRSPLSLVYETFLENGKASSWENLLNNMLKTIKIPYEDYDDFDPEKQKIHDETALRMAVVQEDDFSFRRFLEAGAHIEQGCGFKSGPKAFQRFFERVTEINESPSLRAIGSSALLATMEAVNTLFELAGKVWTEENEEDNEQELKRSLEILGPALNGRKEGYSAFGIAVDQGNLRMIKALIMAGTNVRIFDKDADSSIKNLAIHQFASLLQKLKRHLAWLLILSNEAETTPREEMQAKNQIKEIEELYKELLKPALGSALEPKERDVLYYRLGESLEEGLSVAPQVFRPMLIKAYSKVTSQTRDLYQEARDKISFYQSDMGHLLQQELKTLRERLNIAETRIDDLETQLRLAGKEASHSISSPISRSDRETKNIMETDEVERPREPGTLMLPAFDQFKGKKRMYTPAAEISSSSSSSSTNPNQVPARESEEETRRAQGQAQSQARSDGASNNHKKAKKQVPSVNSKIEARITLVKRNKSLC